MVQLLLFAVLSLFVQGEAFLEMDYTTFDQTDKGARSPMKRGT